MSGHWLNIGAEARRGELAEEALTMSGRPEWVLTFLRSSLLFCYSCGKVTGVEME